LFALPAENRKGLRFWLPAVLVLGPVALVIRMIAARRPETSIYLKSIIETLGNLIPVVISYTVALVILILKMLSGSASPQLQVILMFGLPIIVGLMFHGAFLAPVSNKNFIRFIRIRLPQVLTTTFLALGGIIPVALPLVNKNMTMSLLVPLSPFAVMTWWAIVVLGSLLGGFLIFIFEFWAVKRGFQSWTVLEGVDGEVITPSWAKIWWWFLISIVILFAGLIAGIAFVK
jgi:hypothetical protein